MKFSYRKAFTNGSRTISENTLNKMIQMTNGYAYGFQLLDYLVWETEKKNINEKTLQDITLEY